MSFRQEQIIQGVCEGKINKAIAWDLHLTEGSVKTYMERIFKKAGVENRTQLAVWALTRRG